MSSCQGSLCADGPSGKEIHMFIGGSDSKCAASRADKGCRVHQLHWKRMVEILRCSPDPPSAESSSLHFYLVTYVQNKTT